MIIRGKKEVYIGIDPGIVSGLAVWHHNENGKYFQYIAGCKLFELFTHLELYSAVKEFVFVRIENPNTWRPFRTSNPEENQAKIMGAGAVKQTFKHIIEYLDFLGYEYVEVKIQGTKKKVKAPEFIKITGWQKPTNEHGRDAAMLVYDY